MHPTPLPIRKSISIREVLSSALANVVPDNPKLA